MKHYKVAVLLSTYNGEKYIEQQIHSITNQKNIDSLTIIVRDDGSWDGTLEKLLQLQKIYNNIEVIQGKHKGLVSSFFDLLNYAYEKEFDYYALSDQDDYWLEEKLNIGIKAIENHDDPYMYSACSAIVDNNLLMTGEVTQKKLREITFYNSAIQNLCPGHNQILNRAMAGMVVLKTVYSSAIYSHDLWITNVAAVTGTIIFDNTPHTLYRQHGNNQLSFGRNKMDWVKDHVKRLMKSEGKKISTQLRYFTELYGEYMTSEQYKEAQNYYNSKKSLITRFRYIKRTRLYRQRRYETAIFKAIYLLGGY